MKTNFEMSFVTAEYRRSVLIYIVLKSWWFFFTAIDCGAPDSIYFGHKTAGSSYQYSDVVIFGCQLGYMIHGDNSATCQKSGEWTTLPECVGKGAYTPQLFTPTNFFLCVYINQQFKKDCELIQIFLLFIIAVVCSDPPEVANSTLTSAGTVNYGDSSFYHCDEGFYMTGFSHVTCKADGTWSEPPTCASKHYNNDNYIFPRSKRCDCISFTMSCRFQVKTQVCNTLRSMQPN